MQIRYKLAANDWQPDQQLEAHAPANPAWALHLRAYIHVGAGGAEAKTERGGIVVDLIVLGMLC